MEENIKELSEKITMLENRVAKLELKNKKMRRNKIITTIITIVIAVIVAIIYIILISSIYGNYTNIF